MRKNVESKSKSEQTRGKTSSSGGSAGVEKGGVKIGVENSTGSSASNTSGREVTIADPGVKT